MNLVCKQCAYVIQPEDINIERLIAKCAKCGAVFSFADDIPPTETTDAPKKKKRELYPALPRTFTVELAEDMLIIRRRWYSPKLIMGACLWTVCVSVILIMYRDIGVLANWGGIALVLVFFGLPGLYFLYLILANSFVTTVITVTEDVVDVKTGPLPFVRNKLLGANDVIQIYTKRETTYFPGLDFKITTNQDEHYDNYGLYALLKNGKGERLLPNIAESQVALCLKKQMDAFLALEDQPVAGEVSKN